MHKKILILLFFVFWALPSLAQDADTAWVRRYNGSANSDDYAKAIAVDGSGNVYVTGKSKGSGTDYDYATIKYHPNGDTAWVRRYNGPGDSTDVAYAIMVDSSGNIYVTGKSKDSGTDYDYATIKYYPNGDTAWVRRYNGPGNRFDGASGIAVDGSGNIYVTGYSYRTGTYKDYATIKYDPNGNELWVRIYNGPADSTDVAHAIMVDSSGNVYVTGKSRDSVTYEDYATIKYDPDGNELWVRRYNGPADSTDVAHAIWVDDSGNVYVTGYSYGDSVTSLDYTTIKYYPDGDTAWVRRYDGPGNGGYFDDDYAYAIAVDGSGNVYVTGRSNANETYGDYATIKYYPNGNTAWVRRYNGPGNYFEEGFAIAIDGSGNVYVTGESYGDGTWMDYATIRYFPNGDIAWVERYNGPPGNAKDEAYAIAIDDSGNVYVTGYSDNNGGTERDYTTIRYIQFLRGDANGDGEIDISDVVYLINYLFIDGPAPDPLAAGDTNCSGVVDIADVVYLINYLFIDGPPPSC